MPQDFEQAFLNTVIAFKLMSYSYSLKCFFKDNFKKGEYFFIPFSHILYIKRHVFHMIRDTCEYVCPFSEECDGHKFLNFIEKLYQFQQHAVLEEKCFFRDFYFYNFKLKKDKDNGCEKVAGWDFNAFITKDLSHLTYSQRCQYLN